MKVSWLPVSGLAVLLSGLFFYFYPQPGAKEPLTISLEDTAEHILIEYSDIPESVISIRAEMAMNCHDYYRTAKDHKVSSCLATRSSLEMIKELIGEERIHSIQSYYNTYRKNSRFQN